MNLHHRHKISSQIVLAVVLVACFCLEANAQWETVHYNNSNLQDLTTVAFTTTQYGLAASDDGEVIRTQNGGRSWEIVLDEANDYEFKDIQFVNPTSAFAVGRKNGGGCVGGDEGVIAYTQNYGATWDLTYVDTSLNAIYFPNANIGYAVGNCGAFYKTINAGQDWSSIDIGISADIKTLHFVDSDLGFIGGNGFTFLKTTNGGTDWNPVTLNSSEDYRDISFTSATNGYLLSNDKVYRTTDGGDNWLEKDYPGISMTSLFFVGDEIGYLSGNNLFNASAIYKTTDGADNWDEQTAGPPSQNGEFGVGLLNDIFFLDEEIGFAVGAKQFNRTNTGGESLTDVQFVIGNVIHDIIDNCTFDAGEPGLEDWLVEVNNGGDRTYTSTDALGNYFLALEPGNYDIRAVAPNSNWSSCNTSFTLADPFDTLELNIPVQSVLECPVLSVDISTHTLTHCADNEYIVRYCNLGTATAVEPYVEVVLHEDLSFSSSTIDWLALGNNTYQFDLDDIAEGDCGVFYLTAFLDCSEALVGQTHSVEARIFPDDFCETADPGWDESSLDIEAVCEGDSAIFTVRNIGLGAMATSDYIIIIEDHILLQLPTIILEPDQDTTFRFYPNGNTLRLELNQHPLHPGEKKRAVSLEGCGTNATGGISMGYVTQYPEHDGNPFHSLDCQESTTATNLAMKKAYPKGYGVERYTEANVDLDYHIHFQNNGTDTVYTVIIQDTLSQWLDASSIRPGSASHSFDFTLSGNGIARFVLKDIQLPPASVNEAASHGFVKFRVRQLPDNPPGTLILNSANIAFDYGVDAVSNETTNLIEADFVELLESTTMEGQILTDEGMGVGAVYMELTNSTDGIMTDTTGAYLFENIDPAVSYVVTPSKDTDILNGVDALDLFLIGQHIVGIEELDSPYKMVAADVNKSGTISTLDILHLQKAILLIDTIFSENESWRFVEAGYTFPNPVNPLAGDLPEAFLLSHPDSDNQIHFKGIKIGDVDDSADPHNLMTAEEKNSGEPLELYLDDIELQQGNYYDVPVYVNNTADLLALQFALAFDTEALEYIDLQADAATKLRSDNFGFSFLELGVVTVCWYDQSTQETTHTDGPVEDKSLLFNLRFLAKKGARLSELLTLQGDFVSSRAYERKGDLKEKRRKLIPELSFESLDQNHADFDHSALGIFPNPVNDVLYMHYTLDSESDIRINLVNALGQSIKTFYYKERRLKGTYKLDVTNLPRGTYFIDFEANGKSTLRKMVKL